MLCVFSYWTKETKMYCKYLRLHLFIYLKEYKKKITLKGTETNLVIFFSQNLEFV